MRSHTPMIASTKGLIGSTELALMKPTARVLNVARGGIIDETALLSALEVGTIAGAGLDVFTSVCACVQDHIVHGLITIGTTTSRRRRVPPHRTSQGRRNTSSRSLNRRSTRERLY